jgi:hypothetical protein
VALKHKGKEWTVVMPVLSTGMTRDRSRVFLNSEKDFRSERNLTIVLDVKSLASDLKAAGIKDIRKHFAGKKIEVKGTVTLFKESPQIEISKLEQVKVLE